MNLLAKYRITRAELMANIIAAWLAYILRGLLDPTQANIWIITTYSILAAQFLYVKFTRNALHFLD